MPPGQQAHRGLAADQRLGDRADGAVAAEGADQVDALVEGLLGLAGAGVALVVSRMNSGSAQPWLRDCSVICALHRRHVVELAWG